MFLVSIWWKIYKIFNFLILTLINDGKQIIIPNEINLTLKRFYENLFKQDTKKSVSDIETFWSQIQLPTIVALKSMPNNKSPSNDGLSKEFYEAF